VAAQPATEDSGDAQPQAKKATDMDAFRIGYNAGMVTAQLQNVTQRMDDNKEFLKQQFASLRETSRTHHEGFVQIAVEHKQHTLSHMEDKFNGVDKRLSAGAQRHQDLKDYITTLTTQKIETLTKHFESRHENIQDLFRIATAVVVLLLVWILAVVYRIDQRLSQMEKNKEIEAAQKQAAARASSAQAPISFLGRLFS
jgi:hypothetical protein